MATLRSKVRHHNEAGFSLLMAIFLVATSLIISAAVLPSVLTQGRREREEEMVWRGEQYERGIRLYFQKFGRYPTKIDDLTKQTNGVRFLRQAYPDPVNKQDGSWRFIYVGPNGQLIGSVKSQSLLQSVLGAQGFGGASGLGAGPTPPALPPGASTGVGALGAPVPPGQQAGPQSQLGQQPGQQPGQPSSGGLAPDSLQSQPQPLGGAVIGGNIIGVGSKIKETSLRVYEGGDTYEKWEFIWNPSQQVAIPGQGAPVNQGPPQGLQQTPQGQQSPSGNGNVPLSTQPVQ